MVSKEEWPNLPEPQPVILPRRSTAVLVLDMNRECEDPHAEVHHDLLNRIASFLDRVRQGRLPIVFTISLMNKGGPLGEVASPLKRRAEDSVLHPDGFDKFTGGELERLLRGYGTEHLIIVGRSTNVAVMYTATAAARVHKFHAVVPMDGVAARRDYENHYALHQLSIIPRSVIVPITFSLLDQITFE